MHRCLKTTALARACTRSSSSTVPWFVDSPQDPKKFTNRPSPPHLPRYTPKLPENIPPIIKNLHAQLTQSPHLEPSTVLVSESIAPPAGPELPLRLPQGRRKRGGTYWGESSYDVPGGIWNWVVMAQVKEGTEDRGAIESVVRLVRKSLLTEEPPLPLPPNAKQRLHNGWALIDAGEFAVHILSREAREKYFSFR